MDNKALALLKKSYHYLHRIIENLRMILYIFLPLGRKVFVVGTPLHGNIGDSAIVIAELDFLSKVVPDNISIKELSVNEYKRYNGYVKYLRPSDKIFFWHGGGNMGDLWYSEESFRRQYIFEQRRYFPVIFPQTIYYSHTVEGMIKMSDSVSVYDDNRITIVARELTSFHIMKSTYPRAQVMLTPDIVLSEDRGSFGAVIHERKGVLLCARNDEEKKVENRLWDQIVSIIEKQYLMNVTRIDMFSECEVTKKNRSECVRKKMQDFCGAELVITDRLHGMIFAALTGTPCIVFSNYNHKVKGTYDWISYLPYIKYVDTIDEAVSYIPSLISMKNCCFDGKPLMPYFAALKNVITENINKQR